MPATIEAPAPVEITCELFTLGGLAVELFRPVATILAAIHALQIQPLYRINGSDHFTRENLSSIALFLDREKTKTQKRGAPA